MSSVAFVANGKPRIAEGGASVGDLLRDLGLAPAAVVVEYNGEPLERDLYPVTLVREGDRIEIAQMVGGG
jgi:thiamine biosynthesis protein ThiS